MDFESNKGLRVESLKSKVPVTMADYEYYFDDCYCLNCFFDGSGIYIFPFYVLQCYSPFYAFNFVGLGF